MFSLLISLLKGPPNFSILENRILGLPCCVMKVRGFVEKAELWIYVVIYHTLLECVLTCGSARTHAATCS